MSGRPRREPEEPPPAAAMTHVTQGLLTCSIDEFAGRFADVYEAGGANARNLLDSYHRALGEREASIAKRDERTLVLVEKVESMLDRFSSLAEKTAELAMIDARKAVALEVANRGAAVQLEALKVFKEEVLPVARALVPRLLPGRAGNAAAHEASTEIREVVEAALEDDVILSRLVELVGIDKAKRFADWAGEVLAAPQKGAT